MAGALVGQTHRKSGLWREVQVWTDQVTAGLTEGVETGEEVKHTQEQEAKPQQGGHFKIKQETVTLREADHDVKDNTCKVLFPDVCDEKPTVQTD